MSDKETEALLSAEGWAVECWSPLEIRHEDGSFATNQAARAVIDSLAGEAKLAALQAGLAEIGATARMAHAASADGFEKRLWLEVEKRASSLLAAC